MAGLFSSVAPRQAIEGRLEEACILSVEPKSSRQGVLIGEQFLDARKSRVLPDFVERRPGADAKHDMRVSLADTDWPIARKHLAREDGRAFDEQIAVPGEAESGPHQDLVTVAGNDLVTVPRS